jgi:iron complex outermembrane recepter protein
MKKLIFTLATFFPMLVMHGQQINFSGKVISKDLKPLEGVTVYAELNPGSETLGKVTDQHGFFTLPVDIQKTTQVILRFTYIGYQTLYDTLNTQQLSKGKVFQMQVAPLDLKQVTIVSSVIADPNTPVASQVIQKEELRKLNLGQDLPVLLNASPSLVFTSDAGAGVGYTSLRIRGSDQSRINVTLNGIPLNDPESQGVFWVNMPDFASSASQIQIQRGVGTSTNGAGAFGGNINIETFDKQDKASFEINNSVGSFNTRKHTVAYNSGLIDQRFKLVGRLSRIASDGYIDRAFSDLSSYYLGASYQSINQKFKLDAIHFSGREKTYQSWWGTPESRVNGNVDEMNAYADRNGLSNNERNRLLNSGRTYNYYQYDNETDNYQQDHYQLHANYELNKNMKLSLSGFYVKGQGYYEQFRANDKYSNYGFDPVVFGGADITFNDSFLVAGGDTIRNSNPGTDTTAIVGQQVEDRTDMVRQRWLDNHFFGGVYAFHYSKNKTQIQVGGGANRYIGDHFGEIIWAQVAGDIPKNAQYYYNQSVKDDINSFVKVTKEVLTNLYIFGDLQYRIVNYKGEGIDQNRVQLDFDKRFNFFNPKAGASYQINNQSRAYFSVSTANREPVRRDFVDAVPGEEPQHETLIDWEAGYNRHTKTTFVEVNLYHMDYFNQLVLTGEINDVGGFVRRNAGRSHRTGIELQGAWMPLKDLTLGANLTLSQNRIREYREVVQDWAWPPVIEDQEYIYTNTPIAFSPNIISAVTIDYKVAKGLNAGLIIKYVGEQYLDNTGRPESKMDAYLVPDFRLSYKLPVKNAEADLVLLVNNLTNAAFSSNGYTYKYFLGEPTLNTERMLYPQAGRNFLLGLNVRF